MIDPYALVSGDLGGGSKQPGRAQLVGGPATAVRALVGQLNDSVLPGLGELAGTTFKAITSPETGKAILQTVQGGVGLVGGLSTAAGGIVTATGPLAGVVAPFLTGIPYVGAGLAAGLKGYSAVAAPLGASLGFGGAILGAGSSLPTQSIPVPPSAQQPPQPPPPPGDLGE